MAAADDKKAPVGLTIDIYDQQSTAIFRRVIWERLLSQGDYCRNTFEAGTILDDVEKADLLLVLRAAEAKFEMPMLEGLYKKIKKQRLAANQTRLDLWRDTIKDEKQSDKKNIAAEMRDADALTFGFLALTTTRDPDNVWDIDLLCTKPQEKSNQWRGSYGTMLIRTVLQMGEDAKIPQISLHALPSVVLFYRQFGFRNTNSCTQELPDVKEAVEKLEENKTRFKSYFEAVRDTRVRRLFYILASHNMCGSYGNPAESVQQCLANGAVMTYCANPSRAAASVDADENKQVQVESYSIHHVEIRDNKMRESPKSKWQSINNRTDHDLRMLLRECFPNIERIGMNGWLYMIVYGSNPTKSIPLLGEEAVSVASMFVNTETGEIYNVCTTACERGRGHMRHLLAAYLEDRKLHGKKHKYPKEIRIHVEPSNAIAIAAYHKLGFVDEPERESKGLRSLTFPSSSIDAFIEASRKSPSLASLAPPDCKITGKEINPPGDRKQAKPAKEPDKPKHPKTPNKQKRAKEPKGAKEPKRAKAPKGVKEPKRAKAPKGAQEPKRAPRPWKERMQRAAERACRQVGAV